MFYNNGTIFDTTFEQNINIPKLGEHLAELLNQMRKIYETCSYSLEKYSKLIIETEDISVIILKLGEDSNIALFFKKEKEEGLKLKSIKRYITKIEELIDADKFDLLVQEMETKEGILKNLEKTLITKQDQLNMLKNKFETIDETLKHETKEISKDIEDLEHSCTELQMEIEIKEKEVGEIAEKIEGERKKELIE
ncbi:MAG: hypothetical protein EU529_08945 [Promethearchaeota archaeon]|nr:MAG: hypothetical protein EU529_08945 [Candidatus Lokiarchaeota archaeon]